MAQVPSSQDSVEDTYDTEDHLSLRRCEESGVPLGDGRTTLTEATQRRLHKERELSVQFVGSPPHHYVPSDNVEDHPPIRCDAAGHSDFQKIVSRNQCGDPYKPLNSGPQRDMSVIQSKQSIPEEENYQVTPPVCDITLTVLDLWDAVHTTFSGFRHIEINNQWRSVAIHLGINIYLHRWAPLALRYVYMRLLSQENRPSDVPMDSKAPVGLNQLLLGFCRLFP